MTHKLTWVSLELLLGALPAILGLSVIYGWYTHNLELIQVYANFVPMQFNTGFAFVLSGIGLIFIIKEHPAVGKAFGIAVLAIGILTLVEYSLEVDLFIDQLLMDHYITTQTAYPGRMAPNTAISFSLIGISLILFGKKQHIAQTNTAASALGSCVFGLAFIALTGYFLSYEAVYGWGKYTRMAVHTAVGFIILGITINTLAWRRSDLDSLRLPSWFPVSIFIIVMTGMLSLWQAFDTHETKMKTEYGIIEVLHPLLNNIFLFVSFVIGFTIMLSVYLIQSGRTRTFEIQSINKTLKNEIRERRQVEATIKSSEERYRELIESSPNCVHQINHDGAIISMNKAGLQMLGIENESLIINAPYLDLVSVAEQEHISKLMESAFKGTPSHFEFNGANGQIFHTKFIPLKNEHGNVKSLLGISEDITEKKKDHAQLHYQATHDDLTGLVNRREFNRRIERILKTIITNKSEHVLCYMDLDQFKVVNDTCGHEAGDELLRQLSDLLVHEVRKRDSLARLGGDEFGILMEHCSPKNGKLAAESILKTIQNFRFIWNHHLFKISASIGLVVLDHTISNLSGLLKDADAACYMAKEMGRNRIHVYHQDDKDIAKRMNEMRSLETMHEALDKDRLCLYAQKILPLNGSSEKHYELLVRMLDNDNNTIPPKAFLPAAERYNIICNIDLWVIKRALNTLANHPDFLVETNFCSINLSGQSLNQQKVLSFIIDQFSTTKVDPHKICFEITETAAIMNLSSAIKFISALKGLGCRFALDDFGTGLSSFTYLKNLPVDYLKIDGTFVRDIVEEKIDYAMVKSINEIGQLMRMQTIAEFVETDETKDMLKALGINYAQGYGIHKPEPFDELILRTNNIINLNERRQY